MSNPSAGDRPPRPDLAALPSIPRDDEGPVFRAPWEAQAFAMAVKLHEAGHFTWTEWAARLADEIAAAGARGEDDDGSRYYLHWLAALEKIAQDKGLVTARDLAARKEAWDRAARAAPHGSPIELPR
ncbi:MAG: nitrile hydratase accessory protein [Myxococcales bacterium]